MRVGSLFETCILISPDSPWMLCEISLRGDVALNGGAIWILLPLLDIKKGLGG